MSKLNSVKVKFANSDYDYITSVSAQTTEESAKDYFIGQTFDRGTYPVEDMQKVISIEFIDNNKPTKSNKNVFFSMVKEAKNKGSESFTYKGKKYIRGEKIAKNGAILIYYRKSFWS
jgi:hypothetical protein